MADSTNEAAAVELPKAFLTHDSLGDLYTPTQMQAYARAAIAAHAAALAGEAVAWEINATLSGRGWEHCTRECYEDTLRTGRYAGIATGTKDVQVRALFTHPTSAPDVAGVDVNELRRAVFAIGVVGMIGGHDVIRRNSVLEIIDRRIAAQQETAHAKA